MVSVTGMAHCYITNPNIGSRNGMGSEHNPKTLVPGSKKLNIFSQRKYYYVVISTGESSWELPQNPAPGYPNPGPTTVSHDSQFKSPSDEPGTRGMEGAEGDRSLGVRFVMWMNE